MIKVLLFFICLIVARNSAQDDSCTTPFNQDGQCISIKFCKEYLELLSKYGPSDYVSTLLRQAHCGWEGQDPFVCCPRVTVKMASTETSERIAFPPSDIAVSQNEINGLPKPPFCGLNQPSKTRIVNGVPAYLGEYPWIVALGYRNSKNPEQPKWLCGGTMITDKHILTAGHCVHNRPDLYLARLGELDLYSDDDGAQPSTSTLSKAKVHEQYNPTSYTNDIAILTLSQPHKNPTVKPICLPLDEPLKSNDFVNYTPLVAGWGALYFNGPSSSTLQTTTLPVVTNERCSRAFINFRTTTIDHRVLCAGYLQGGKDACQGDSGGPLMYSRLENKNFTYYQIGVVSYGFRCAEQGFPGVYTRVTAFVDWIQNNLD
ncbi:hypothetical protein PPYR_05889 [Photinus pyralis]|uniref:CLIP domain-containing serine protease n=1 Tax=Photinus pyralis TaxID=7054 RepID=A0A1Y1M8P7_PHOPY|nr:venom protease-like [Photinus pyralis]KAB0801535.1 hypothetical protein PPYR_05889 [Photinus pyralis]